MLAFPECNYNTPASGGGGWGQATLYLLPAPLGKQEPGRRETGPYAADGGASFPAGNERITS